MYIYIYIYILHSPEPFKNIANHKDHCIQLGKRKTTVAAWVVAGNYCSHEVPEQFRPGLDREYLHSELQKSGAKFVVLHCSHFVCH